MGVFTWVERKLFTGEVVRDFGEVQDEDFGLGRSSTSLLLCRRRGRLMLVFRMSSRGFDSRSVHYVPVDARPEILERLRVAIEEARAVAASLPSL